MPGNPQGLGEQQAFVYKNGRRGVIEVIEYVEGRKAVTQNVPMDSGWPTRQIWEVIETTSGCILTATLEVDTPLGQ